MYFFSFCLFRLVFLVLKVLWLKDRSETVLRESVLLSSAIRNFCVASVLCVEPSSGKVIRIKHLEDVPGSCKSANAVSPLGNAGRIDFGREGSASALAGEPCATSLAV